MRVGGRVTGLFLAISIVRGAGEEDIIQYEIDNL